MKYAARPRYRGITSRCLLTHKKAVVCITAYNMTFNRSSSWSDQTVPGFVLMALFSHQAEKKELFIYG